MFQHLPSLKALQAFEAAARLGSFNAAATELSVTPGAISYQIKQLESSLENPLFYRRTRQVELTDAGMRLHRTVHRLFQELKSEIERISPERKETQLTVSVTTYFVTRWLSPRLGKFLSAYPEINVRLQHSVNDPDFTVEDADVAIRWGDGEWNDSRLAGSHSELLFTLPMIAVCSPKLLTGNKPIKKPDDISQHILLKDQPGIDCWPEWLQLAGVEANEINTSADIVDPNVRIQSAIDGHGLVLANPLLNADIQSGSLSEPFYIRLHGYGYYLLSTPQAAKNSAFRLFRRWLLDEAESMKR
jgi:LysR family glycine cleavage system transcriptional activator